jgi:hypothetical protein
LGRALQSNSTIFARRWRAAFGLAAGDAVVTAKIAARLEMVNFILRRVLNGVLNRETEDCI